MSSVSSHYAGLVALGPDLIAWPRESFTEPATWWLAAAGQAPRPAALRTTASADLSGFEVTREFVRSKDGTRVPINVIAAPGMPRDGTAPALLTGYGGFGISLGPHFDPDLLLWREQGGVYVVASIRGGGEYRIWPQFRESPGTGYRCAVSRTRLRGRGRPARPNIWRLIILMWLTRPSTGPELQFMVRPLVTASRSCSRPLANDAMPGRPAVRAVSIHGGRFSPLSSVIMVAKARTWPDAACSSGQRSRMALSRGFSSSVRVSGCRVSQFVTSRTVGGAGGSGALAVLRSER
jgi:hypothetical protein